MEKRKIRAFYQDKALDWEKWKGLAKLELDRAVGVGYLIPPSRKFVCLFQKFEKRLENVAFLNMFGSRLIFKCRKQSSIIQQD